LIKTRKTDNHDTAMDRRDALKIMGWIWRYRDQIALFVRRNIVVQYKQTILGPLWYLIQPILTVIMNMVVFGGIAKMSMDGMPKVEFSKRY